MVQGQLSFVQAGEPMPERQLWHAGCRSDTRAVEAGRAANPGAEDAPGLPILRHCSVCGQWWKETLEGMRVMGAGCLCRAGSR